MDIEIIHDLLTNCIDAIDVLAADAPDGKFDAEFRGELASALKRLPPLQISKRTGALQEWVEDYSEPEPQHRHVSHMFGLHPGRMITPRGTPELAEALRKTLIRRGDEATGWSRAWKTMAWARLEDGDHAYKIFKGLLRRARIPTCSTPIRRSRSTAISARRRPSPRCCCKAMPARLPSCPRCPACGPREKSTDCEPAAALRSISSGRTGKPYRPR